MNDSEFEHDEDCEDCGPLSAPFTIWDVIVAFFGFIAGVFEAASNSATFLLKSAAGAANHSMLQKQFADETRMTIEAIPVSEADNG